MTPSDKFVEAFIEEFLSETHKFRDELRKDDLDEGEKTFHIGRLMGFEMYVTMVKEPMTVEEKAEIDGYLEMLAKDIKKVMDN